MPYRYKSVAKALAAAQRMANRTGRPIKVLVQNPRQKYPKRLASKYIRQEFRAGRKGKQAVAIGIARARRAAKKNPKGKQVVALSGRLTNEYLKLAMRPRASLSDADLRRMHRLDRLAEITRMQGAARSVPGMGRFSPRLGRMGRGRKNPEWLTGAVSRKIESGQHMTHFYDSGRKLRAEMFETGSGAPRLLVYNPAWKPPRRPGRKRRP